MNVLHVIPAVAQRYGGPSQAIVGLCRAIVEKDVRVLVASTDADGPGRLPVPLGEVVERDGVPMIFFHRQWSEAFKYSWPLSRWLIANAASFDLVHVHAVYSHASLAGGAAARRAGVPYIVRPLGSLSPWALGQKQIRKRVAWFLGVKRMLEGAAAIHCTSDSEAADLEPFGLAAKAVVVPLGVPNCPDRADDQDSPASDSPYVLALGRVHPKKGLDRLIQAFVEVQVMAAPTDPWRLVIAGTGDPKHLAQLRKLAQASPYPDRIVFKGWVSGREREQILRNAALLAMPSHQENFGLSAFEAMACGVPVLVSRCIDLAAKIEQAGAGWVCDLDVQSAAAILGAALQEGKVRRTHRGMHARSLVETQFSWPVVAEQLLKTYRNVISNGQ